TAWNRAAISARITICEVMRAMRLVRNSARAGPSRNAGALPRRNRGGRAGLAGLFRGKLDDQLPRCGGHLLSSERIRALGEVVPQRPMRGISPVVTCDDPCYVAQQPGNRTHLKSFC